MLVPFRVLMRVAQEPSSSLSGSVVDAATGESFMGATLREAVREE